MVRYLIVFAVLLALELLYFRLADHFNIIDRPNERSSHSKVVLRGGGIIFVVGCWLWALSCSLGLLEGQVHLYLLALTGITIASAISFVDDIHSLPDSIRLVAQFIAMGLILQQLGMLHWNMWWIVLIALVVFVGASNIYNFMDGINGITGAYSLAVLVPLLAVNGSMKFIDTSFIVVVCLSLIVFCIFNFRPKNKARCFAGDVGSVGIAFIVMFCIGKLVMATGDVTWLVLLIVYGVDGCLTICHRIMLHENLGQAHRKHAYQLMANELGMSHIKVSSLYALLQMAVSFGFIYLCPLIASSTAMGLNAVHWIYLAAVLVVLSIAYIAFMKKYYHLHEEYLETCK